MLSSLIEVKTLEEIEIMKQGAALTLDIISKVRDQIRVGHSTQHLDSLVKKYLQEASCTPAFFGYSPPGCRIPYPSYACFCINEEVFHAPSSLTKIVNKGDLVTIDLGLRYGGLYADCANTMLIGDSSAEKLALIRTCADAIQAALPFCVPGGNIRCVTKAIDSTIRKAGFFPVEDHGGHGIGSSLHQSPFISNSTKLLLDCELTENMVLCIEPACSQQNEPPQTSTDGWTVHLSANNLSAHVERMVRVVLGKGQILQ